MTAKRSVRLRFKDLRYDRIIRLNTESIARKMGFSEDQVLDITLAVEEAYTNAIEHSGKERRHIELEILFQIYPDRLEVSVHDTGCGFCDGEPIHLPEADYAEYLQIRGRGLGLIQHLSDRAEIFSAPGAGTLIKITKYLVPPKLLPHHPAP